MLNQINSLPQNELPLSEISYVKRVTVGSISRVLDESALEEQVKLLNRCLNEFPRGRIINIEITRLEVPGDPNKDLKIVIQRTTYHVGFKRKPSWIDE